MHGRKLLSLFVAPVLCALLSMMAVAQQYNPEQMKGLKWRLVGPYRGGRVLAVTGIPGDPYTFYFGGVAGGVWRTSDGGNTWVPLTDHQPFASIGAIAVAESNPSVIYVALASPVFVEISPTVTACSNPPMVARAGITSA